MRAGTITLIVVGSVLLALILAVGIPTLILATLKKQTKAKKPKKLGASFSVPWIRLVDLDRSVDPNIRNQWAIYPDGSNLYFVNEGNGCNGSRYRFTDQGEIFSECLKQSGDPAAGEPGAGYIPVPAGGFNIQFKACVSAFEPGSNPPVCNTQDQCKTPSDCLPNQDCLNSLCVPKDPTGYAGPLLQIGSWSIFPDRRSAPGVGPQPYNLSLSFVSSRGLRAKFAMTDIGNLLSTCQTGLPVTGFNQVLNPEYLESNGTVVGTPDGNGRIQSSDPCATPNPNFRNGGVYGAAYSCPQPPAPQCTVNTDCPGRQNCLGGTCFPGGIGRYADTKITLGGWTVQEVITGTQPNLQSELQFLAPNGRTFVFQDQGNFVSRNVDGSVRGSLTTSQLRSPSYSNKGNQLFCNSFNNGTAPGIIGSTTFNVSLDDLQYAHLLGRGTGGTYTIMNESGGNVDVSDGNNGFFTVEPNVSVDPPLNTVVESNGSSWITVWFNNVRWQMALFDGSVIHFPRNGRDPWARVTL